jgi:hypothetical protein
MKNALPRHVELAIIGFGPAVKNGDTLPPLAIAPHRMTQTVFNLVKNAGDALRTAKHGRVEISARLCDGPASSQSRHSHSATPNHRNHASSFAELAVSDNGPGMTADIKARAAEPFFTTKTRGLSTGLGLSLVHGIVSSAGGSMDIQSAPQQGTRITLNVPIAADMKIRSPRKIHTKEVAAVSLADPRHRTLVQQVLASLGFEVKHVENCETLPRASIWIIQSTPSHLQAANEFLDAEENRLVLVAGQVDREFARPGLISIGESFRFSRVRDTIRQFSSTIQERSHDQRADSGLVRR